MQGMQENFRNVDSSIRVDFVNWTPVVLFLVVSFGTMVCYIIALGKSDVSHYLPLISEIVAKDPQRSIFSITLIFATILGTSTVCVRYLIVRYHLTILGKTHFHTRNGCNLAVGILSMLFLLLSAGVATSGSTQVTHRITTCCFFVCAMLYTCFDSYMNKTARTNCFIMRVFRQILCVLQMTFTILYVIMFPIATYTWEHYNKEYEQGMKTPERTGFGVALAASICEWILCLAYYLYMISFWVEFRRFQFSVSGTPKDTTSSSHGSGTSIFPTTLNKSQYDSKTAQVDQSIRETQSAPTPLDSPKSSSPLGSPKSSSPLGSPKSSSPLGSPKSSSPLGSPTSASSTGSSNQTDGNPEVAGRTVEKPRSNVRFVQTPVSSTQSKLHPVSSTPRSFGSGTKGTNQSKIVSSSPPAPPAANSKSN